MGAQLSSAQVQSPTVMSTMVLAKGSSGVETEKQNTLKIGRN